LLPVCPRCPLGPRKNPFSSLDSVAGGIASKTRDIFLIKSSRKSKISY
jgi:hypothetical protein